MKPILFTALLCSSLLASEVEINNPDFTNDNYSNNIMNMSCGDYDYDGYNDILVVTGRESNPGVLIYRLTVYSYVKDEILMSVDEPTGSGFYTTNIRSAILCGNFNNNNASEIVFNKKVYSYNSGATTSGN